MGNLSWKVSWQDLKDFFNECGTGELLLPFLQPSFDISKAMKGDADCRLLCAVVFADVLRFEDGKSKVTSWQL